VNEPLDWAVLLRAFRDATDWVLDVAAHTARDYPDEVAAVERVRKFAHSYNVGRPAHLRIDDLLFTFALVLAAVDRDLAPFGRRPPSFAQNQPFEIRAAA
jgi:hypothetical protein